MTTHTQKLDRLCAQFDSEHKLSRAAELLPMRKVRCTECRELVPVTQSRTSHLGYQCYWCFRDLFED